MEPELFRHKTKECRKDRREKQGEEKTTKNKVRDRSTKPFAAIDITRSVEQSVRARLQLRDSPAAPGPRHSSHPGQMRNPIAWP